MSWAAVTWTTVGAGIGAAVGESQKGGGWKKGAMIGGAVGLGGSFLLGGAGAGAGAGGGTAGTMTPAAPALDTVASAGVTASGAANPLGTAVATTGGSGGASIFNPATLGSALMLGQAGLGIAQAFNKSGSQMVEKIEMSPEGKALMNDYSNEAFNNLAKRKTGNVNDKAFGAIHKAKVGEERRQDSFETASGAVAGTVFNAKPVNRGTAAIGGNTLRNQVSNSGQRLRGLFAPSSILNNFRREELFNAVKQVNNVYALEHQTASFEYGSNLSQWLADQRADADRGAAIGNAMGMMGSHMMMNAYVKRTAAIA